MRKILHRKKEKLKAYKNNTAGVYPTPAAKKPGDSFQTVEEIK